MNCETYPIVDLLKRSDWERLDVHVDLLTVADRVQLLVNAINGGDPRTSGEIFRTGRTSHVAHH